MILFSMPAIQEIFSSAASRQNYQPERFSSGSLKIIEDRRHQYLYAIWKSAEPLQIFSSLSQKINSFRIEAGLSTIFIDSSAVILSTENLNWALYTWIPELTQPPIRKLAWVLDEDAYQYIARNMQITQLVPKIKFFLQSQDARKWIINAKIDFPS